MASHYSVVTEEEMQLGACLVEIGASISTLAVFNGGGAVHIETLPIGSDHLTRDLAAALNCNISAAERIKTLYGSALSNPSDSDREIRLPQEGLIEVEFLETHDKMNVDIGDFRDLYLQRIREYLDDVRIGCTNEGANYLLVDTSTDIHDALLKRATS